MYILILYNNSSVTVTIFITRQTLDFHTNVKSKIKLYVRVKDKGKTSLSVQCGNPKLK